MFLFSGKEAHRRSILKAISWRALGSVDTFVLGLIFTSSMKAAGSIAATEVITKILLYYFHERAWAISGWGHHKDKQPGETALSSGGESLPPKKTALTVQTSRSCEAAA